MLLLEMSNPTSSNTSELLLRASSISNKIVVEENNLKQAVENKLAEEQVEFIKNKINFLKRKQLLFNQAAKMQKIKS